MDNNQCGPNCSYRKLYESSQISLSDMSSKQAGALARVGRIRASIVSTIRKNFPKQTNEFERTYGSRLSEMDDELILAFLENVVNVNNSRDLKSTLEAISQALLSKGIIKDGSKPSSWLNDILNHTTAHNSVIHQNLDSLFGGSVAITAPDLNSNNAVKNPPLVEPSLEIKQVTKTIHIEPDEIPVEHSGLTEDFNDYITDIEFVPEEQIDVDGSTDVELGWVDSGDSSPFESLGSLFGNSATPIETREDVDVSMNTNSWSPSPIKPENISDYGKKVRKVKKEPVSRRKEPRVQATAPQSHGAQNDPAGLDERLKGMFMSAVTIPRPVFTKDLLSLCPDYDVILEWEESSRANPDMGLRFISPKQRHRHRGSLVIPAKNLRLSSKKKSEDWWNSAIELYMGSKLYELGVLLHRVGDEVVSYSFNDLTAVIKLNTPKGIVVIIVVMNDRTEAGTEARSKIVSDIKQASQEKLAFIAILSTLGEEKEMERLLSNLTSIHNEEDLGLSTSLVCSRTWEFADDRGSTSKLISGS